MIQTFNGEYRWLSNFFPVEVTYEGRQYPSVEHAYQSAKLDKEEWQTYCTSDVPARKVKRASKGIEARPDWQAIKVDIMRDLLVQKFSHPDLKEKLIATGDQYLMEGNTWNDTFWGVDIKTGEGENVLGKLIMEIRTALNEKGSET